MNKIFKTYNKQFLLFISLWVSFAVSVTAQYSGGNGDGYASGASALTNFASVSSLPTPATIFEELSENQVSVYPNPASGIVTLSGLSAFAGGKSIKILITDQNGKTLITKTITKAEDTEQIDISQLVNGVYFINMQTDKEKVVKRIVKE